MTQVPSLWFLYLQTTQHQEINSAQRACAEEPSAMALITPEVMFSQLNQSILACMEQDLGFAVSGGLSCGHWETNGSGWTPS